MCTLWWLCVPSQSVVLYACVLISDCFNVLKCVCVCVCVCVYADVHVVSCMCITSSAVQEDLMENALSIIFPFICALYVLPQATLPYYAAIV